MSSTVYTHINHDDKAHISFHDHGGTTEHSPEIISVTIEANDGAVNIFMTHVQLRVFAQYINDKCAMLNAADNIQDPGPHTKRSEGTVSWDGLKDELFDECGYGGRKIAPARDKPRCMSDHDSCPLAEPCMPKRNWDAGATSVATLDYLCPFIYE